MSYRFSIVAAVAMLSTSLAVPAFAQSSQTSLPQGYRDHMAVPPGSTTEGSMSTGNFGNDGSSHSSASNANMGGAGSIGGLGGSGDVGGMSHVGGMGRGTR
jgi:hypothetical protein